MLSKTTRIMNNIEVKIVDSDVKTETGRPQVVKGRGACKNKGRGSRVV